MRVLADRLLDLVRRLVELGQDLALDRLVRLVPRGHLERFDRAVHVRETVSVDEPEVVPEVELEIRVPGVRPREPPQHLPERALERLPVLLRREDLVDALERLEERRVQVERLVEQLDGAVLVVLLVTIDLRHRVEELRLADRVLLHLGDRLDGLDHLHPVLDSSGRARGACEGARGSRGWRSSASSSASMDLFGFLSWSFQMSPISLSILEALVPVGHVVEDLPLVGDDLLPVLEVRVERDERLERHAVRRIDTERLLEVVDRLLRLPLLAFDAAELVVDVRRALRCRPRRAR